MKNREVKDAKHQYNDRYQDFYRSLTDLVESAKQLGASETEVNKILVKRLKMCAYYIHSMNDNHKFEELQSFKKASCDSGDAVYNVIMNWELQVEAEDDN